MNKTFRFSDSVCMRLVQIFQEVMIFGIDGADLLRQVEMSESDDGTLQLTPEYKKIVAAMHESYIADAKRLQEQKSSTGI